MLQKQSKTPLKTYFKKCVWASVLLKSEGLPNKYPHLPSMKNDKKRFTVTNKETVWRLLTSCNPHNMKS
ncbi:hypothetical protein RCH18_000591 [Flavobacterium sp. PL11]|uniref:hypothetical protein n=1 Tax=Flavobacterium sp. PL11 TaxID=3071717 RepID=UPI002E053E6E|nr:hypothetical protein [Flavobacterium sp. PL11]